jgi:hypothetical protein
MKVRITLEADVEKYPGYNPKDAMCKGNFTYLFQHALQQLGDMKKLHLQQSGRLVSAEDVRQFDLITASYEKDKNLLMELIRTIKIEAA